MRVRVGTIRTRLAATLKQRTGSSRFDFIAGQRGMFSLLGLPPEAVTKLREQHVYIAPDSRINIAGLPEEAIGHLAAAVAAVAG
jgi:aspartate/tyrosine/aromatic aminotransferase